MSNLKVFYFDVYESNDASLPRFMAENFKNEKVEYAYTYDVLSNRIMQAKDTTGKALKMRYVLWVSDLTWWITVLCYEIQ